MVGTTRNQQTLALFCWRGKNSRRKFGLKLILCPIHNQHTGLSPPIYCFQPGMRVFPLRCRDEIHDIYWEDVYLLHQPPPHVVPVDVIRQGIYISDPFRFGFLSKLLRQHTNIRLTHHITHKAEHPSTTLVFRASVWEQEIVFALQLGTCNIRSLASSTATSSRASRSPREHWAYMEALSHSDASLASREPSHDCATDHIRHWPLYSKEFRPSQQHQDPIGIDVHIRLMFTPCLVEAESDTLVLHMLPLPDVLLTAEEACEQITYELSLLSRVIQLKSSSFSSEQIANAFSERIDEVNSYLYTLYTKYLQTYCPAEATDRTP
jgi:hypothetical protein